MTGCPGRMTLPPQSEGRILHCTLEAGHAPETLHTAKDPDGVVRRWPDIGPAGESAGAHLLVVRPRPTPQADYSGFGLDPA